MINRRTVDLLKIDIEGSEFDFVECYQDILKSTNLVFMELHQTSRKCREKLLKELAYAGLEMAESPVKCHGQELVIFKR
ncbi:FkbM family methyltransferase [Acaryochloris sp. 'Moss Beach']|uniref:FkbM family methyltransferase n=1 Tax=Acaryochloris sp. 'Moss Beach' TaxID=2740837 RepID=UPI0037BF452C|nr:FkbM family methyltransferase [Acaryochloris sp. 'Moss Beach']